MPRRLALAVVLMALLLPTTVLASDNAGIGHWKSYSGSGYTYHIPVCLHSNFNGPTWDLSNPRHAALNAAMHRWNDIGGELYFYRTNTTCQYLYDHSIPYLQVGWSNYLPDDAWGRADIYDWWCNAQQNDWCVLRAAVWLNANAGHPLHFGTGTVPPDRMDGESLLSHEIGHTLMLSHSSATADIMYQYLPIGSAKSLTAHDISGYQFWYGSTH